VLTATKLVKRLYFDPGGIIRVLRHPAVRFAVAAGLALYFAYHLTGFKPARMGLMEPSVDTLIEFSRGREIFATGVYPRQLSAGDFNAAFPFPPPTVVLFDFFGMFGIRAFMALWIIFATGGLLITFRASVASGDQDVQAAWLALGAIALVFCDSSVAWDLRLGNCNLFYMGMIFAAYSLLRPHPRWAGVLLALSFSLKLYSGLLFVWLFFKGPKAALFAAVISVVAMWLLLPVCLFGVGRTVSLYAGWREQVRMIGGLGVYPYIAAQRYGPPLVTLRRALMIISGAQPDAAITRVLLGILWAIWAGALLWYGARALGGGRVVTPSRAALADWTILMLAPLPFSPWLEPYHMVPLVPATILCLLVALDRSARDCDRFAIAAVLFVLLAMRAVPVPLPIRGLELLAQFLLLLIAFGLIRLRLATRPDSEEPLMPENSPVAILRSTSGAS
jgi:glycosyl transferase family 87